MVNRGENKVTQYKNTSSDLVVNQLKEILEGIEEGTIEVKDFIISTGPVDVLHIEYVDHLNDWMTNNGEIK